MTQDEFEERWARDSGMTIADLRRLKMRAKECNCTKDTCEGWRMGYDRETQGAKQ